MYMTGGSIYTYIYILYYVIYVEVVEVFVLSRYDRLREHVNFIRYDKILVNQ